MGTVDTMATVLAVWTTISVALVALRHAHVARQRPAFVIAEPRSHVEVLTHLAPVIHLDAHRRRS